jgi:hypothetical protein
VGGGVSNASHISSSTLETCEDDGESELMAFEGAMLGGGGVRGAASGTWEGCG